MSSESSSRPDLAPFAHPSWTAAETASAVALVEAALIEDLGTVGDVTTRALVEADRVGTVSIVARRPGVLAGLPIVRLVCDRLEAGTAVAIEPLRRDGDLLAAGDVVARLRGPVRPLLTGERTALNFLTFLSGTATLAHRYVQAVAGTRAAILDTRKTVPGHRLLQKYAVRCGGGTNHRLGLHDGCLVKDNHLAAWLARGDQGRGDASVGPLASAVRHARRAVPPGLPIEFEVDTLAQLADVLDGPPDIVLLDNMDLPRLREAVRLRDARTPHVLLEASGGVTLETVAAIAATGIDRISSGALTHSAPALDLAYDWTVS
jgi:nicotinate-nucleotide pyrophosphorylase (carboxylating)